MRERELNLLTLSLISHSEFCRGSQFCYVSLLSLSKATHESPWDLVQHFLLKWYNNSDHFYLGQNCLDFVWNIFLNTCTYSVQNFLINGKLRQQSIIFWCDLKMIGISRVLPDWQLSIRNGSIGWLVWQHAF